MLVYQRRWLFQKLCSNCLPRFPVIILLQVRFRTSVSWRPFSGNRVTASLVRSPGLFSVFWSILTLLHYEWSHLFLLFLVPPVSYYCLTLCEFFFSRQRIIFLWCPIESKYHQVSRTLPSILADFNNAVVRMVSARLRFLTPPGPSPYFWGLFPAHQFQLVSPWPSVSIVFVFVFLFARS